NSNTTQKYSRYHLLRLIVFTPTAMNRCVGQLRTRFQFWLRVLGIDTKERMSVIRPNKDMMRDVARFSEHSSQLLYTAVLVRYRIIREATQNTISGRNIASFSFVTAVAMVFSDFINSSPDGCVAPVSARCRSLGKAFCSRGRSGL